MTRKLSILILCGWSLFSCSQSAKENTEAEVVEAPAEAPVQDATVEEVEKPEDSAPATAEKRTGKLDFDFLTDCKGLDIWRGAVQGVPASDAKALYIMAQCASNRQYDLIVYSEREIDLGAATDAKKGSIKKGLAGATYYAFEIPKKEAVDPQDEAETFEYVFPSEVKVYKLFEDGWYLINSKRVSSFEELGSLKINTIHSGQTQRPGV